MNVSLYNIDDFGPITDRFVNQGFPQPREVSSGVMAGVERKVIGARNRIFPQPFSEVRVVMVNFGSIPVAAINHCNGRPSLFIDTSENDGILPNDEVSKMRNRQDLLSGRSHDSVVCWRWPCRKEGSAET